MDKSWFNLPQNTFKYIEGVDKFIDFAINKNTWLQLQQLLIALEFESIFY